MAASFVMQGEPFAIENADGAGPAIIVCDHASNRIPDPWGDLGLTEVERAAHIAWDPGALAVSRHLATALAAPLFAATVSRLVIDLNRPTDSATLMPSVSETTTVPGNTAVTPADRARRIGTIHTPYHAALDRLVAERLAASPALIAIHTYTPVFKGRARPWHVGVIHGADARLAAPVLAGLDAEPALVVGRNEPYAPSDDVYYTLERHAVARGLRCVMIEIRNDEVADAASQAAWGARLARVLRTALATPHHAIPREA